jgi:hypothetical protein
MSATPSRAVKCQVCTWTGIRRFGNGILVEPCPSGHRVTYAAHWDGDQPVTPDDGTIQLVNPRRTITPERKAQLLAALAFGRERKAYAAQAA